MASLKVSNMRISNTSDSAEKRPEIIVGSLRQSGKLFQMIGPGIVKRHPSYVESLTGGTTSWFLLTDLRQSQGDELCDAG